MRLIARLSGMWLVACWAAACSQSVTSPSDTLPTGVWGGTGLQMTVTTGRTSFDFGCDVGSIEGPVILGPSGTLTASGTFAFGRGGPRQPTDPPLTAHPAVYSGITDGRTLRLTVFVTDLSRKIGDYELVLGRVAALDRCL